MLHNKIRHVTATLRNLDLAAPDARQRLNMVILNLDGLAEGVECLEANFIPRNSNQQEDTHAA